MGKKKALTGKTLFEQLQQLPQSEQLDFLNRVLAETGFLAHFLRRWKAGEAGVPIKRGKPARDALILKLAAEGLSDAQIGWDDRVIALNDGQRMDRRAVQRVRLRKGGTRKKLG